MIKALKIDVVKQEVYYVDLKNGLDPIYDQIGNDCSTFAVPVILANRDGLYVDDEAYLFENRLVGGFMLECTNHPLCGNALIIGTGYDGESQDCLTQIEEITNQIIWMSPEEMRTWAVIINNTPPIIRFF